MMYRILIVDDDPQIRRVMRAALTGASFEVSDARTGEDGLQAVRDEKFDLVLLDVNMPGIGGMETCRLIRANSEIAIIMLTVRNAEQEKVAALDAGADDYVTKPFGMPELLARIRAALRRLPAPADGSSNTVKLADFDVNLTARRVVVHGQQVRLTPKEFDLLQYFLATPIGPLSHGR